MWVVRFRDVRDESGDRALGKGSAVPSGLKEIPGRIPIVETGGAIAANPLGINGSPGCTFPLRPVPIYSTYEQFIGTVVPGQRN
jgi:hypothetical protein